MKKNRFMLFAMMITLATATTEISAEKQRKNDRNQRDKRYEKKDHNKSSDKEYKKGKKQYKYNNNSKSNKYNKQHDKDCCTHYGNKHQNKRYSHKSKYNTQKQTYNHRDQWYRHPRHGVVYRNFYSSPTCFRYKNHDFYYYRGDYYRYHRGIGYVRVELPGRIIIEHLPANSRHFTRHGQQYYRCGDLVFERFGHRYKIHPNLSLQLAINF